MTDHNLTTYLPRSSDVTHERLDGEVIAVHLGSGSYFSMTGPAADVWWLICRGVPVELWVESLAPAFPGGGVDAESFAAFLEACLSADLIALAQVQPATGVEPLPSDYPRAAWSAPELEEFSDLRDLILVDPVHDTTDQGWPHVEGEHGDGKRA